MKLFKTYKEQVELLGQRGMQIDNSEHAEKLLAQLNYYRLSGYWYPMRSFSQGDGIARDEFVDGASFDLVVALYGFDDGCATACSSSLIAWSWLFEPSSVTN
ncbi:Abi family protein [Actinotignum urinale]|uniref:Abi family protein n=1 Tax=Actinotignum urinale TaxID=190146 RepID=UPI00353268D4